MIDAAHPVAGHSHGYVAARIREPDGCSGHAINRGEFFNRNETGNCRWHFRAEYFELSHLQNKVFIGSVNDGTVIAPARNILQQVVDMLLKQRMIRLDCFQLGKIAGRRPKAYDLSSCDRGQQKHQRNSTAFS